jgi:hypothetical protein
MTLKEKISRKVKFYRVSYKQTSREERIGGGVLISLLLFYFVWALRAF